MLFQLATIRKRAGMTQKETAEMLGVGQSAVSMWENGDAVPRAELLPKLADVLGCTIDELYGRGKCEREDASCCGQALATE